MEQMCKSLFLSIFETYFQGHKDLLQNFSLRNWIQCGKKSYVPFVFECREI